MAAGATPAKAPQYFTNRADVKLGKGQAVRFARGKGYYAGAPVPADPYAIATQFGMTPAALRAAVNASTNAQVVPQRQAITQQQAAADRQFANQQATLRAITDSYRQLLSGIGPQVQSDYTNAGNAVADYAKGYSGAIQNQLNDAGNAEKSLLATAGAPGAQVNQTLGHLAAPIDALYGIAGAVPAGALAREGAAMSAAADQLPAFAVGRGQENALQLSGAQQTADQQYRQQLSNLLSSIPKLRSDALSSIQSNAAKAEQLAMEEKALGLKTDNQAFNQRLAVGKQNFAIDKFNAQQAIQVGKFKQSVAQWNARQKAAATKIDVGVSTHLNDGFAHNANGDVVHGPNGKPIKFTPKLSSSSSSSKPFADLTKTQVATLRSTANELRFGTVYNGKNPVQIGGVTYKQGDRIPPFSYQEAISFLVSKGFSRPDAILMLNKFYPPGKNGRPSAAAARAVKAADAAARKGKDATGLGIQVP